MATQQEINEALVNDVLMIYSDAEDKMLKAVAKRVAKGIKTEGWNESKLKDTQLLKGELEKVLNSSQKLINTTVDKGIIDAYTSGSQEVTGGKTTHKTVLDSLDVPMNLKMQVLAANNLLSNATFQVLRKANDAYQKVMANATTGLLAGVDTRIQATQKMLNEFAAKGITTFVDKAGRNWDLSSYAEMAVRTVSANAARQGHFDRQVEVGEDLVKVSSIGTTCPICQRWQGVVLSISGKHPKYHSIEEAKAAGLFHPNCKHTYSLFVEELDGPGKAEPDDYNENTTSSYRYDMIQKQRANERQIRYWKKRKALAITPEQEKFCNDKIRAWQYKNLIHCEKHGLRRQYAREGVMTGHSTGPKGTFVGGNLKEYEEVYKNVVGDNPGTIFKKLNLQFFASDKTYEQWLKDEIQSLDELDVDKAMMKDANNKAVTPTSLYKKYIGDNPMQDYAAVSEYEKGTKEFKSSYAKWLKTQIDEIGVSYKVKPKYVEVHEDIPDEDKALSATNIYKKYYGEAPTEAFKKLGGEAGTGMKYGKWVETQKKELIKNGITKTVPFENKAVQKTTDTIKQASEAIAKTKVNAYKLELDSAVHGQYDGFLKVKEQMEVFKKDMSDSVESEKLDLAKAKHLEMVKKKAEKLYDLPVKQQFEEELDKLKWMLVKEKDPLMKVHAKAQIDVYEGIKESKASITKATSVLGSVKVNANNVPYGDITTGMKENIDNPDVLAKYKEAYKIKKKEALKNQEELNFHDEKLFVQDDLEQAKKSGSKVKAIQYELQLEILDELEKEAIKAKKEAEAFIKSAGNKVTLGRETKFNEGQLVERDRIYQNLDLSDLEKLSDQVAGHKLFENSNRRDILGRDKNGRNHHMGHDVRTKSGLTGADKELAEAFAFAYNDYFNTIKCQPINVAYLQGYENASPAMRQKIDKINMAIQSVELNEPILLHRYVDKDIMKAIFGTDDVHSLEKGDLFDNNTFMSTSAGGHPTFGKRDYKLTLQVDKGTHALPTLNHEELEVLLGKGKLEFVRANKYTSTSPQRLRNYDGSWTEFVGDEVVVRYIEEAKASEYEKVTAGKIADMLDNQKNVKAHQKESKEWIDSLSPAERTANKKYTGNSYAGINNVYRRGDHSNSSHVKWAKDLTTSLRRAETKQPVVLRRGIHESDLAYMLGFNGDFSKVKSNWDTINEGGYAAEDKGFLSTSPVKTGGFTSKDVELRIYCPAGTHAAYVDSISTYQGEQETLLQSGSMYKVVKLEEAGSKTVAYLELLGTD